MTQPENRMESFVVRVWLERREIADAPPEWRGVIEHVASGKRKYFLDLDTIAVFMAEYMRGWGVKSKLWLLLHHCFFRFNSRKLLQQDAGEKQR